MRYEVRWEDGLEIKKSNHESEKGAKNKAREMSAANKFRMAQMAEIKTNDDGTDAEIVRQWTFEEGKQTSLKVDGVETMKVKPAQKEKGETQPEAPAETTEVAPAEKPKGKEQKKKTGKTAKASKKVSADDSEVKPEAKSEVETVTDEDGESEMSTKASKILETLEVRKGTNKERAARFLATRLGKQSTLAQIGRATYGSGWSDKSKSSLSMVVGGLEATLKKKKAGAEIRREKEGKEITIGLHSK